MLRQWPFYVMANRSCLFVVQQGCGLVVPGAGFALNNFLKWADLDRASPASIQPGRLASETDISCMSPIMIFKVDPFFQRLVPTPGSNALLDTAVAAVGPAEQGAALRSGNPGKLRNPTDHHPAHMQPARYPLRDNM
jgi:hypothetical protein